MNENYIIDNTARPFLDWCKEYGASPLQVRALVSLGIPFEEALQAKARRRVVLIQMNGQTKPLSAWCQQYGIASATVIKRIEAGYPLEEAFESGKYQTHKIKSARRKQEQKYSITKPFLDWCRDYLADPLRVRAAMSVGYSLEYALKNIHKERNNQIVMQVQGKTDTFLNLCSQHEKAVNTVRKRVKMGIPLEEAFSLPPFKKGEIDRLLEMEKANEPHSITQSLSGWCRDYSISQTIVEQRLQMGMTIEQALAAPHLDTLRLDGKEVSLGDLCKRLGLDLSAVNRRISRGMSILEAINDVASPKPDNRRSIDGDALKEEREKAGLSQSRLAELVNGQGDFRFTKYTIHSLEHGKRFASPEEFQALETALGCDIKREGR